MNSYLLWHDCSADKVEGELDWKVFTWWLSLYKVVQVRVTSDAQEVISDAQISGVGWIWMRSRMLACLNLPPHSFLVQNQGKASYYGVRNWTTQSLAEQTLPQHRGQTTPCALGVMHDIRRPSQGDRSSSMWAIIGKQPMQARRVGFWTVSGERGLEDGITGCSKWS